MNLYSFRYKINNNQYIKLFKKNTKEQERTSELMINLVFLYINCKIEKLV